jgi:hypothetical protein
MHVYCYQLFLWVMYMLIKTQMPPEVGKKQQWYCDSLSLGIAIFSIPLIGQSLSLFFVKVSRKCRSENICFAVSILHHSHLFDQRMLFHNVSVLQNRTHAGQCCTVLNHRVALCSDIMVRDWNVSFACFVHNS